MRRFARPLLAPFAVATIGLALFGLWMRPAVLEPTNIGWLMAGDDRGQAALGLAAYLRDPAPWPSLRSDLLAPPDGPTLLFTDSIPLIGAALRPFAGLPPAAIQFIGVWYLLCALLQATLAWALVRAKVRDPVAALIGAALLAAMPMFLARYPHASLCAQWLILWALWIFVDRRRSAATWWWPAALVAAALVHAYLLLMAAAFWASAVLAALVRGGGRVRTLAQAALAAGLATAALGASGAFDGPYASSGLYGNWPAPLDAWWNPRAAGYSALLPPSRDDAGVGFEGFHYLGAGLLAVAACAIVIALRGGAGGRVRATARRLAWLGPAAVVLLAVAIGPAPVWRDGPLFHVALPSTIRDALDPVRAASRLAWPATYVVAYLAIIVVGQARRATLLLGAALALQAADLSPMIASVRQASARADDRAAFARTRDPRWAEFVGSAAAIDFQPPDLHGDLALMQEVSWRAVIACRPVLYTYAARQTRAAEARTAVRAAYVRAGVVPADRMVVFLHGPPPATLAARVVRLDGVAVLPPRRAAPPSRACGG